MLNGQPTEDVCYCCGLAADSYIDLVFYKSRDDVVTGSNEQNSDGKKLKKEIASASAVAASQSLELVSARPCTPVGYVATEPSVEMSLSWKVAFVPIATYENKYAPLKTIGIQADWIFSEDMVWEEGLICKIKSLPDDIVDFRILKMKNSTSYWFG